MAEDVAVTEESLTELGEEILNDEGQVELSVLIDAGQLRGAQVYLLGAADALMKNGSLTVDDAPDVMRRIGLPLRDVERIRGENAHRFL